MLVNTTIWINNNCPKFVTGIFARAVVKPVMSYRLWRIGQDIKKIEIRQGIQRKAEIICAFDGALNCGRDQQDWFEECFANLGTFLLGGGPTRKHYIEAILAYEDSPLLMVWRTKLYLAVVRTMWLMHRVPTWVYCATSFTLGSGATLLICLNV